MSKQISAFDISKPDGKFWTVDYSHSCQFPPERYVVRLRLAWAARRVIRYGTLNRSDIAERWEVSLQTAAGDIKKMKAAAPDLMSYDPVKRCYFLNPDSLSDYDEYISSDFRCDFSI